MTAAHENTLTNWYLDEVGGEATFLALAASTPDRTHARKWESLAALERETARRIANAIAAEAAPVPAGPSSGGSEARIADVSSQTWNQQMTWLRDIASEALEEMTREAAHFPYALRQLVEFVLAHERALVEFATRELAGDEQDSLRAVQKLLGRRDRQVG